MKWSICDMVWHQFKETETVIFEIMRDTLCGMTMGNQNHDEPLKFGMICEKCKIEKCKIERKK